MSLERYAQLTRALSGRHSKELFDPPRQVWVRTRGGWTLGQAKAVYAFPDGLAAYVVRFGSAQTDEFLWSDDVALERPPGAPPAVG